MASHGIDEDRTKDVVLDRNFTFSNMLLPEPILTGLNEAGFFYPSMIQKKGIPIGRCGYDMLVQSKSGTGKTLVFSVIALEKFNPQVLMPQTLILSPTREIAVQTADTLKVIGKYVPGFKTEVVIGGLSVTDNRKDLQGCSAVVGSPGRILHLIQLNVLNTKHINLLILDEIDLLTDLNFNLDEILAALPKKLQVITVSATLDKATEEKVSGFMNNPIGITPAREVPVLVGIGQFVCPLLDNKDVGLAMLRKSAKLVEILSKVAFKQCFIFANSQFLAESYKKLLEKDNWPSEVITGAHEQKDRLSVLRKLKEFKIRVLFSTDLMARGIDAENVNLVVNMDVPSNGMVYLHRIGRAGRFGTRGLAITLIATEQEKKQFQKIQEQFEMWQVMELPQEIDSKGVWEMAENPKVVERKVLGENKKNGDGDQEEEGEEEDVLSLLLDSSSIEKRNSKKENVKYEEVDVQEDDTLAMLLDSSVKFDAEERTGDVKSKKSVSNILKEFDAFSETETPAKEEREEETGNKKRVVFDTLSMENNIESDQEVEDVVPEKKENSRRNRKKKVNANFNSRTEEEQGPNWDRWQAMFNIQCDMIQEFVRRNRRGN